MGRDKRRPFGVALWAVKRPLLESDDDLDEVKIIGVNNGKVYVWKKKPGKDAYVAQIKPQYISKPQHAPYLVDPPPGTEDEAPAVGDIGNPENFSGNLADIAKVKDDKPVPGVGEEPGSGWLPSKKLEMIAKKMKALGLKPQDTFSKAVAAGEPVPTEMPPAAGLKGLADQQGVEVDDADLEVEVDPEVDAGKEEEPKDEKWLEGVKKALADGKLAVLWGLAAGDGFGSAEVDLVQDAWSAAQDAGDWKKEQSLARLLVQSYQTKGDSDEEAKWQESVLAADPAWGDIEQAALDEDWDVVGEKVEDASSSALKAAADLAGFGTSQAVAQGDFGKAAQAAKASSAIAYQLKDFATVKAMLELEKSYQSQVEDKTPPSNPTVVEEAPPSHKNVEPELEPVPWYNPKGKPQPLDEAAGHQKKWGLKDDQFINQVSGEIFSVVDLDTNLEYVDGNGIVVNKASGKPVKDKSVLASGTAPLVPPLGVDFDPAAYKIEVESKLVEPPAVMPPEAIAPNQIPEEKFKPGPETAPDSPTPAVKAAQALPLPADVPKPEDLTLIGSGKFLGGAGEKHIYKDAKGQRWMFKVAADKVGGKAKPFSAVAQQMWANIAKKTKKHLPVGVTTMQGKIGTLQPLIDLDEDNPNLAGTHPKDLSPEDLVSVAEEHMLDWLMSQHDTHGGNLVRGKDGKIYSIDKEQGFRFLGTDKLDPEYAPNTAIYGEQEPYYNKMMKAMADGEVKFNPQQLQGFLHKIEGISSADYIEQLQGYATTMWPKKEAKQKEFILAARRRKLNLRKDFEALYTKLLRKQTGEDGNFSFSKGWSGKALDPVGPKVTKKTYTSQNLMDKLSGELSDTVKTVPYYSDFATKTVDNTKLTLKVGKGAGEEGLKKVTQMLASLGMKPEQANAIKGPHYNMFFIDKAAFEAASIEVEEVETPPTPGTTNIGKAPETPHYFPDDYAYAKSKPNAKTWQTMHKQSLGQASFKVESDGPSVEGSLQRVQRRKDAKGEYYSVSMKLRPQKWNKIKAAGGGEHSTFEFKQGFYDAKTDTMKDTNTSLENVNTKKWETPSGSELHIAMGKQGQYGPNMTAYAFMGGTYMKVRPKPGQSIAEATKELLDTVEPGLGEDLMRDATPAETEVYKLSQALWAYAPQVADKLPPEDQRDPMKLRLLLKKAKVSAKKLKGMVQKEVFPGHSTWVDPSRSKNLREKTGFQFLFHGVTPDLIGSILTHGAIGISQRRMMGIAGKGISEESDIISGTAENILTYMSFQKHGSKKINEGDKYPFAKEAQLIIDPREADRMDSYFHDGDRYGVCNPNKPNGVAGGDKWRNRKTLEKQAATFGSKNAPPSRHEVAFKRGINPKSILRVTAEDETTRKSMVKNCLDQGIKEVNGVPIEDFIVVVDGQDNIYEKYVQPLLTD